MRFRGAIRLKSISRFDINIALVMALSIIAIAPLLQPGFFWGAHDARHSVYFLYEFDRSIQERILYPRWSPDITFGYGYPLFNIYSPLAFYLAEGVHLVGLDLVWAIKVIFALAFVLSGVTMYLFVRRLMGSWAGVVAGLVYVYIPYHLSDVYVRGAFAESVALIFLPLILWCFYETVERPRLTPLLGAGLSYAGLVLSHNGLLLLFSPFLGIYLVFLVVSRSWEDVRASVSRGLAPIPLMKAAVSRAWMPLAALLLGLGLSAIFWLPMAVEFRYVRLDQWLGGYYDYRDDFVYFFQFFSPFWGHGLSRPGPEDDLSFQIGAVPVVLSILSVAVSGLSKHQPWRRMLLFFQGAAVVIVFLMLAASTPVWEILPIVIFAQFPWRLLALLMPCVAFLAGSIVAVRDDPNERAFPLATVALAGLVIFASYAYLTPQIIEPAEGSVSVAAMMRFMQSSDQMTGSVAWTHEVPRWSAFAEYAIGEGQAPELKVDLESLPRPRRRLAIDLVGSSSTSQKLWVHAEEGGRIIFNIFYYPGWRAYVLHAPDGSIETELEVVPHGSVGKVSVIVPAGEYYLLLRFEDTAVRVAGQVLSSLSLLTLLACWGWQSYRSWVAG